jgi:hypothetical protein
MAEKVKIDPKMSRVIHGIATAVRDRPVGSRYISLDRPDVP